MQKASNNEFYALQAADGTDHFIYGNNFNHEDDGGNWGWSSEESCYPSFSLYTSIASFDSFKDAKTAYDIFDSFMQSQIKIVKIIISIMVENAT